MVGREGCGTHTAKRMKQVKNTELLGDADVHVIDTALVNGL